MQKIIFDISEFANLSSKLPFYKGGLDLQNHLIETGKRIPYEVQPIDLKNFTINWQKCPSIDKLYIAPALYKFTMPNGLIYIGQSANVRRRIITHLFKIMYNRKPSYCDAKWYYKANQQFQQKERVLDYLNEVFTNLTVEIFYLSSGYEAMKVEKIVLEKIWNEGRQDFYYNSQFYKTDGKGIVKPVKYNNPNVK